MQADLNFCCTRMSVFVGFTVLRRIYMYVYVAAIITKHRNSNSKLNCRYD